MKKEIDIWQFVRIMVEAETNKEGEILLDNFGEVWQQLDNELKQLGETDLEAYADMMLHQNIVLEVDDNINTAIVTIIHSVIAQLTTKLNNLNTQSTPIDQQTDDISQDLAFEIQNLEQTVDELVA